jgi:hypothetical protein
MTGYLFELEKKEEGGDEEDEDIVLPSSTAVRKDLMHLKKDERDEAEK